MSEQDGQVISGTVLRLFFSSATFSAGLLLPATADPTKRKAVTFAGKVYVKEGDYVVLRGRWIEHPKYGRQWAVEGRAYDSAIDVNGLATWLAVHGDFHGVGPVTAERLAKAFGADFTRVLREEPERVAEVGKLSAATVSAIAAEWGEREEFHRVATHLAAYELTDHQISELYEAFGGGIIPLLEDNPYLLIGRVVGLGFKRVDGIARKVGTPETHPGRLEAAVLYALGEANNAGSTCLENGELIAAAVKEMELGVGRVDADDLVAARVAALANGDGKLVTVTRAGGDTGESVDIFHATPEHWRYECAVHDFLADAGAANPFWTADNDEDLHGIVGSQCSHLDESQQRAVVMALQKRGCLISGGAGAGKTTLVKAIAGLYRAKGLRVALCAPTGKAARRMEEVVGVEAKTIHRLLEFKPISGVPRDQYGPLERADARRLHGVFTRNEHNPIDADVVIVDEVSMVSSDLAYVLFRAIGSRTNLALVGDHHQLPPVGPGALLRDAILHRLLPMTLLTHCHRQAGVLKRNCAAILDGIVRPTENESDGHLAWVVMDNLEPDGILEKIEKLFTGQLAAKLGVDPIREVQFLSPLRTKGAVSCRAVNLLVQRLYQKTLGVEVEEVKEDARPKLHLADKVINTRNNYTADVMNGHIGEVVGLPSGGGKNRRPLIVNFDGKAVSFAPEDEKDVELAYCLTPHKYQGSEIPVAVVVCHSSQNGDPRNPMLHRNWLYTSMTRAQRTAVLLGDSRGISSAARTVRANERRTVLGLIAKGGQYIS